MIQQRLGRIQWGDLQFGPGNAYSVASIEGIDDLPGIRSQDLDKADQHGDYTGPDYTAARTVQITLNLLAASPDELRALTLALRRATQPQRQPAELQLLDWDIAVRGKVRKRALPYDAGNLWRAGSAAIEWYCADPYLYGLAEQSAATTAYSPAAGRTYPRTYPMTYGDSGAAGKLTATNGGDSPAYPLFRIDGPVASPSIEQTNVSASLVFDTTLQPGEFLTVDTRSRAVLFMGTTPRRSWLRGGAVWPLLLPGDNEITYRGAALPGAPGQTSLLTATWRDTSL